MGWMENLRRVELDAAGAKPLAVTLIGRRLAVAATKCAFRMAPLKRPTQRGNRGVLKI